VIDGDGQPIATLRPEDFEVELAGKKRRVVSAQLARYGSAPAAASAAPATRERHTASGVDQASRQTAVHPGGRRAQFPDGLCSCRDERGAMDWRVSKDARRWC
jgi:hypothetical protein